MMSTFQGIFGSVVKSIESDPIGLSEQLNNSCLTPSFLFAGIVMKADSFFLNVDKTLSKKYSCELP